MSLLTSLFSTSLAESDRKRRKAANTYGSPVKFPSKLLAIAGTHTEADFVIAEADGTTAGYSLDTNEVHRIGRNATAPITSALTFTGRTSTDDPSIVSYVFAGGWDKQITRSTLTNVPGTKPSKIPQISFKAHEDFVKCLLIAQTPDKKLVLLSGGADGALSIWTLEGQRLTILRPQSRGIEHIALDPLSTPEAPHVFFSTSQREIYSFTLPPVAQMSGITISPPIIQHETSVYKLVFDNDGDLWTASADKTAKRLVRENSFVADTTLAHPDFVRDIVLYESSGLAITACRDEDIRVWSTASTQLLHIFTGHFEEVTGLALSGHTLLSVSIDATLRKWGLAPQELQKAIEETKIPQLISDEPEPANDFGGLTAEEEAQLQALMEEEEADTLEKMVTGDQ